MEKLIVKNFGPIKEAEIDLTKYVVFIGDTSTGKSVLAKLISIFRQSNENLAIENNANFRKELNNYNINFNFENSIIKYKNVAFFIELQDNKITFNRNFDPFNTINNLNPIFNNLNIKPVSIYFPAERILNSIIGSSISGLWANNVALPNYFKNFAANYEVARKEIKAANYEKFGFDYFFENGEDKIQFKNNTISLSQSSSGIQSLIPLLILFDYYFLPSELKTEKSFLIEEPELNLFPIKQKILTEYIIDKIESTDNKLILTTHSPYILSALDTLILANNTFVEHPELKNEVSNIVPESKWLDYNQISVYEVRNDGKVYSLKNDEYKSIDANAIDSVSDIISDEFEKLTDLRYAH